MRDGVKFHLYISEIPCGDASLGILSQYDMSRREQKQIEKDGYWTGAKTLDGDKSFEVGIPRIKSGRSDIPDDRISMSMSCSDKILMWNCVGV